MTIVHQAVYGDKEGGYALLKTSLADIELAKRICNSTDLLDRPSNGYLTQAVVRGFALNDNYIFIKSFPDNDPSVRKGRVLSHVLIVDKGDLDQINDLDELLSHFLPGPDKDPEFCSILINSEDSGSKKFVESSSREAAAINGLLHLSSYNNSLIWIGEENYFFFIAQLWRQLNGNLRGKLNMGVGFSPHKIANHEFNILYVMEDYENKWKSSGFFVVGKEALDTLESMSSFRLAGYKDKSRPLDDLIDTFGIFPEEIDDLEYIESVVPIYENLSSGADFYQIIVLCDLVSKYSPDQHIAGQEKRKLLLEVIERIPLLSAEKILKLKNPDFNGFPNGKKLIGEQITGWLTKSLPVSKIEKFTASLISAAFDPANKTEWWKKSILVGLESIFKNWKSSHAIWLSNLFLVNHKLVEVLRDFIPSNSRAENDFVEHWQKIECELAQTIRKLSKDRNWLILHGLSTLQLQSPEESIKSQLIIDTDVDYPTALNKMADFIPNKEFLKLTINIAEPRLVKIAGEIVTEKPSLFAQLNVKNIVWRKIWLESIDRGKQPFDGIKKPANVVFALLEEVVKGVDIEPELLLSLSKSDFNDISNFKHRSKVWGNFDEAVKLGFIKTTTLGCIRLLDENKIGVNEIEDEIRICLSNSEIADQIIFDQTITVHTKILLFKELTVFGERELLILIDEVLFSPGISKEIGQLIMGHRWNQAAQAVATKVYSRNDLKPALIECKDLLGFFQRLGLSSLGYLSNSVSVEEWWSALLEQCYTKYPKGPIDKGLWGRSGGEGFDLTATGTGREIWTDALARLRNGNCEIDVSKLLIEMLNDHPNSEELKQLEKTGF